MVFIRPEEKRENILYLIIWVSAFLLSALRIAIGCLVGGEQAIDFLSILQTWIMMLPFLIVFCLHNSFIAPKLVYEKNTAAYLAMVALLVVAVAGYYAWLYPEPEDGLMGPPPGGYRGRPIEPNVMRAILTVYMLAALPRQQPVGESPDGDSIFIKTDYRTVRVALGEIRYIESMSEYVKIYIDGSQTPVLALLSLKFLTEKLPAERFIRVHRSYIIPVGRLREVGKGEVTLSDGTILPVGEMYRQALKDYLSGRSIG